MYWREPTIGSRVSTQNALWISPVLSGSQILAALLRPAT
jgi:hypothetical protein